MATKRKWMNSNAGVHGHTYPPRYNSLVAYHLAYSIGDLPGNLKAKNEGLYL